MSRLRVPSTIESAPSNGDPPRSVPCETVNRGGVQNSTHCRLREAYLIPLNDKTSSAYLTTSARNSHCWLSRNSR